MMGRYAGDGWYRKSKRKNRKNSYIYQFIVCCSFAEFDELKSYFDRFDYKYNYSKERTTYKFRICSKSLVDFVSPMGKRASNKKIHPNLFSESVYNKKAFLDGLFDSDGEYRKNKNGFRITTTSYELLLGTQQLITDVYDRPTSLNFTLRPKTTTIEGRTVNQKGTYTLEFKKDIRKQDKAFNEDNFSWMPVKENKSTSKFKDVYNIEVDVDNSYTANNIVVHNCQGFSFNGKQLNFDDTRSKLFFEYVRILKECKPTYFLLENVAMKKEYEDVISEHLGVAPILINSSLVSAANRKRLYWTNIPNVTQPKDRNITIKDVIYDDTYKIFIDNRNSTSRKCGKTSVRWDATGKGHYSQTFRAYYKDGKMCCLNAQNMSNKLNIVMNLDNYLYRRSHVIEAERYQTLPDNYTGVLKSVDKRLHAIGNGWTVDVICHIFKNIKESVNKV